MQALITKRRRASPGALLQQALSRAESNGLVRAFADTVPGAIELVRRLAEQHELGPVSRGFVERVLAAANIQAIDSQKPAA